MANIIQGCIAFLVTHTNYIPHVDSSVLFGAFMGGFVLGGVIVVLFARYCFKSIFEKKVRL